LQAITSILLHLLETLTDKTFPPISRKHLGEDDSFHCNSDGPVRWFQHKEEELPPNAWPERENDHILTIKSIKFHNIGMYCCHGYDRVRTAHFIDCSLLALLG